MTSLFSDTGVALLLSLLYSGAVKLEIVLHILPFSFLSDQEQVFESWASGIEHGRAELTGLQGVGNHPWKGVY